MGSWLFGFLPFWGMVDGGADGEGGVRKVTCVAAAVPLRLALPLRLVLPLPLPLKWPLLFKSPLSAP